MRRLLLWRGVALAGAVALTLTACGDDSDDGDGGSTGGATNEETEQGAGTDEPAADVEVDRPGRDEVLDLGYILPESGPLAFLGAPMIQGANLAIEDINAAGGVNGSDVNLTTGDEAGDAALAQQATARLINAGVDGVLGAAASGMTQEIIQVLHDNEIVQCSPANTSPEFSDQDNTAFYRRTVPPDAAVAPIIADTVVADGAQNVAVVARADDYGVSLADLVETSVQDLGGSVATRVDYDPNTSDFSAEVSDITGSSPDAVVIVGFGEAATLIRQLIEAGLTPDQLYGGDGLFGPTLHTDVNPDDPSFIAGMKVIGASGGEEFNTRLNEILPENEKGNLIYGGQSYDCMIIMALGAIAADSTDPVEFNDSVNEVTKDGTQCSTFAECSDLLANGEDIDYEGVSGPLNIDGADPSFGRYAIAQFQDDGTLEVVGSQDVDLTAIE